MFLFSIATIKGNGQERDSLRVSMFGICKGEKYKFYNRNYKLIAQFECNHKSKIFGNCCCSFHFSIPVDSFMKVNKPLELIVYKKFWFKYRDTHFHTLYDPTKKYLVIYRNHRLKNRYAIDSWWLDEKLKYE